MAGGMACASPPSPTACVRMDGGMAGGSPDLLRKQVNTQKGSDRVGNKGMSDFERHHTYVM